MESTSPRNLFISEIVSEKKAFRQVTVSSQATRLDLENRHPPPHRQHPNAQSLQPVPPVNAPRMEYTSPKNLFVSERNTSPKEQCSRWLPKRLRCAGFQPRLLGSHPLRGIPVSEKAERLRMGVRLRYNSAAGKPAAATPLRWLSAPLLLLAHLRLWGNGSTEVLFSSLVKKLF